jgi:hypothetical protein
VAPTCGIGLRTPSGDVIFIAGAFGADVDPTCAKVELQRNKTTAAAIMKTKLRIGAFLRLTRQNRYR